MYMPLQWKTTILSTWKTCPKSKLWNVKWKGEGFCLNTESFVDLKSRKVKSVERWMKKLQSSGQISCATCMLDLSPTTKSADRSIKGFWRTLGKE